MKLLLWNPVAIGLLMLMMLGHSVRAQQIKSPPNMLEEFSQVWNEGEWKPQGAARRTGYMRPLDDRGWKRRMLVFRSLIVTVPDDMGVPRQSPASDKA